MRMLQAKRQLPFPVCQLTCLSYRRSSSFTESHHRPGTMSFDSFSNRPPKPSQDGKMDPQVMNFIQTQQATEMLFTQIEKLTETCWDLCSVNPKDRLDSKQETCLNNCVGRYFDTANFVAERFMKQAQGGH